MLRIASLLLLVAAVGTNLVVGDNDLRYQLLTVFSEPVTWKEAQENCRARGMELVNIRSPQVLNQLLVRPSTEGHLRVWVDMLNLPTNLQGLFLVKSGKEETRACLALDHLNDIYVIPCTEALPYMCGPKSRGLTPLKSSAVRRVVRSAEDCSSPTARSRKHKHKRRKTLRKYKKRRVVRRRGDLEGKMSGKMTGNMEGVIRGYARGTTTGVFSGTLRGALTGIFEGNATGEIAGFMRGTLDGEQVDRWTDGTETGRFFGRLLGDFEGNAKGVGIGEWEGSVRGNSTGEFEGHVDGTFVGNLTGTLKGLQHEYDPENEDSTGFLGGIIDFVGVEAARSGPLRKATYYLDDETVRNMTGEMWGVSEGEMVGNIDGAFEDSSASGTMEGFMNGSIAGNLTGSLLGVLTGNLTDLVTGEMTYHEENYSILVERDDVNLVGNLVGVARGSLEGSLEGSLVGHLEGGCTGKVYGVVKGELWGTTVGLLDGEIAREDHDESTNLVEELF